MPLGGAYVLPAAMGTAACVLAAAVSGRRCADPSAPADSDADDSCGSSSGGSSGSSSAGSDGVHVLMHKPPCCLSSTIDDQPKATRLTKLKRQRSLNPGASSASASGDGPARQKRRTVVDVLQENGIDPASTSAVGRLDYESSGALLFTSDGELNRAVRAKEAEGCAKVYEVHIAGRRALADKDVARLAEPMWFPEPGLEGGGVWSAPAELRLLRHAELSGAEAEADPWPWPPHGGWATVVEFTLREGRNRQIRRLCARSRLHVRRLHRTRFGPLGLGGLEEGRCRALSAAELAALRGAV